MEALDADQGNAAKVPRPESPLQLSVVEQKAWYASPVTWGVAGAVIVGVASVIYFLAPPPPK